MESSVENKYKSNIYYCFQKQFRCYTNTILLIQQDLLATIMSTITFLDEMRCSPELTDQPKVEGIIDVMEHVSDHMPHSPKPNLAVSSSVRDLLECPVCLNAMYPPIHQVSLLNKLN